MKKIIAFLRDEDGSNAIEYGLIASLIALVIVAGATLVGTNLNALFTRASGLLSTATTP